MEKAIKGITVANILDAEAVNRISKVKESGITRDPKLVIVAVGEDPASQVYMKNKVKKANSLGIECTVAGYSPEITQEELENVIKKLNNDDTVDGVIVQLPLPGHLNAQTVSELILSRKDADGFHSDNIMKLFFNDKEGLIPPCTPAGIMKMISSVNIDLTGKNVAIVNRSTIVGKPLAMMFTNENATVTLCHSRTPEVELKKAMKNAEIVILGVGIPKMFGSEYFSEKTELIVDVSINRDAKGKLCGDLNEEAIEVYPEIAYTPVPGGVGPMTVSSLMNNVSMCFELNKNFDQ